MLILHCSFLQASPTSFFTTQSNHPPSLRSPASQGEGCSARLQQTWQSPGKTPCCSMGPTISFAKSKNTFRESKVRFKWGSTMWPTLSSSLCVLECENCSCFPSLFFLLIIWKQVSWVWRL